MLVTRVNRWSLTYCRCLGIKIHSQKSGVKSELVVERFLKLDALNLNWLGVIDGPPLHGQFRKQYLQLCTPTMKKKIVNQEEDVVVQDFCCTIDNFHCFTFLSMIGYTLYFMHAWPCLSLPAHAVTHKLLFPSRISIPTLSQSTYNHCSSLSACHLLVCNLRF